MGTYRCAREHRGMACPYRRRDVNDGVAGLYQNNTPPKARLSPDRVNPGVYQPTRHSPARIMERATARGKTIQEGGSFGSPVRSGGVSNRMVKGQRNLACNDGCRFTFVARGGGEASRSNRCSNVPSHSNRVREARTGPPRPQKGTAKAKRSRSGEAGINGEAQQRISCWASWLPGLGSNQRPSD
jgi:hypothetical protein